MRQVQLTDNEDLETLVSEVEAGESLTIVRGERPVAQIIPFPEAPAGMTADRLAAIQELKAIMDKGYDLGIVWNGREELYGRGSDGE